MTKARDLSNLANGVPNSLINLDSAEIPNLDASKITTGELANARVADLPASKITSGTFADARISQSSVSQHVTSFDDSKLQQDIMVLALQQATDANKAAYSLSNSFIEQFEDSTGIDVQTNTARNSSEYISTIYTIPKYFYKPSADFWTFTQSSTGVSDGGGSGMTVVGWVRANNLSSWQNQGSQGGGLLNLATTATNSSYSMPYYACFQTSGQGSNDGRFGVHTPGQSDCNTSNPISATTSDWVFIVIKNSGGDWNTSNTTLAWRERTAGSWTYPAKGNGGVTNRGVAGSGQGRLFRHGSNGYTNDADNNQVCHLAWFNTPLSESSLTSLWNNGQIFNWTQSNGNYSPTNLRDYFRFEEGSGTTLANSGDGGTATKQSGSGSWDSDTSQLSTTASNATGNFTSVSKTAPATVSKMGIVVLYKNNAGTATLNTDLIAQVSANNGTDYTTVTLTPRGTFSTGINIAVANNVTVTSGTSCKYKISFANQSLGTKETQVHGVGLIY